MAVVTEKKSRTIQNWDQFWKKWVRVIHNSKITHISRFHLSGLCFCLSPTGPAALLWAELCCLGSTTQPHACCRYRPWFPTWLLKNQEWNFQVLCPFRRLHVFIWAFWMQKSRQSSAGSMLWSPGCSQRGGCVGGCILPWLLWVAAVKMQLSLESWMWGTCPHIHAAVSVCPDGCAASPSLSSGAFLCSDHTSWWHCRHTFRNPRQFPP